MIYGYDIYGISIISQLSLSSSLSLSLSFCLCLGHLSLSSSLSLSLSLSVSFCLCLVKKSQDWKDGGCMIWNLNNWSAFSRFANFSTCPQEIFGDL